MSATTNSWKPLVGNSCGFLFRLGDVLLRAYMQQLSAVFYTSFAHV